MLAIGERVSKVRDIANASHAQSKFFTKDTVAETYSTFEEDEKVSGLVPRRNQWQLSIVLRSIRTACRAKSGVGVGWGGGGGFRDRPGAETWKLRRRRSARPAGRPSRRGIYFIDSSFRVDTHTQRTKKRI